MKSLLNLFGRPERSVSGLDRLGIELMDICSGLFLMGTTGSGKTTALRILLSWILSAAHLKEYRGDVKHVTMLGCCCKADEADNLLSVVAGTPMADRAQRLVPGEFTFNVAAYELMRPGGSPATLTRLLEKLNTQLSNASQGGDNQSFWAGVFFDYMHFSSWIAWLAYRERVTLEHIYEVITTSPASLADAKSDGFKQTACWKALQLADKNVQSAAEDRALLRAGEFYLTKQTQLGDNARGAGIQQCSSVLLPFLSSPLYETVCAQTSSFTPETLNDYCCILDAPILVYQQSGMLFQTLVTMMVQEWALRRTNPDVICAVVRDEAQFLIADFEYESLVQSVARSSLLANISAAQNIPLLQAAAGGDHRGETLTRALLANYRTKILLANICDTTNRLFSEMFSQFKDNFVSISEGHHTPDDFIGAMLGAKPPQVSVSQHLYPRLPPEKFLTLRRGGEQNNYQVDGYLTMGGKTFAGGLPFKKVTFTQR